MIPLREILVVLITLHSSNQVSGYEEPPTFIIIPNTMSRMDRQPLTPSPPPDRFVIIDDGDGKNKQDTIIVLSDPAVDGRRDETRAIDHQFLGASPFMASEISNSYMIPPMKRAFLSPPGSFNRLPIKTNDYEDEEEPMGPVKPKETAPEKSSACNLNVIKNLLMMHMMFMMKMNAKHIDKQIDEKMSNKKCDHCKLSEMANPWDKSAFAYEMIDPTNKFIFNDGKFSSSSINKFQVPTSDLTNEITFPPLNDEDVSLPFGTQVSSPLFKSLMRKLNNNSISSPDEASETLSQKEFFSLFKPKSTRTGSMEESGGSPRTPINTRYRGSNLKSDSRLNATDSSEMSPPLDGQSIKPRDEGDKSPLFRGTNSWENHASTQTSSDINDAGEDTDKFSSESVRSENKSL